MDLRNWEIRYSTGAAVVGATVQAYEAHLDHPNPNAVLASTSTDANGLWEFTGLSDSPKDVKVTYTGNIRWYKGLTQHSAQLVRDQTFAVPNSNLLRNGGIDSWSNGTSFVNPANGAQNADFWYSTMGAGDTLTISREATIVRTDSRYSLKGIYVKSAGDLVVYYSVPADLVYQLRGRDVALSIQAQQGVASQITPFIQDQIGQTTGATSATTGSFVTLTAQRTIDVGATSISLGVVVAASQTFYLDNVQWNLGTVVGTFSPNILDMGPISSSLFADGTISTAKIGDRQITTQKIALLAVTSAELADNAVTNVKVADNAINTAELVDAAVTSAKLGTGAVTTGKILDANVTDAKLATPKVTRAGDTMTGQLTITKNNAAVGVGSYSTGNQQLVTTDSSPVILGFHRSGVDGVALYWQGGGTLGLYTNAGVNGTLWHSGNDGPGSGLDADTVDGIQGASVVLKAGSTMTGPLIIDHPTTPGINAFVNSALQLFDDTGNVAALGFHRSGIEGAAFYYLTGGFHFYANSGTTGTFWHTANDGAGSGLDADLVDGIQAASLLARANHTGTQAPGTISPQGAGSGLAADTVDGFEAAQLLARANHTGTQAPATISPQGSGSGLDADKLDGVGWHAGLFDENTGDYTITTSYADVTGVSFTANRDGWYLLIAQASIGHGLGDGEIQVAIAVNGTRQGSEGHFAVGGQIGCVTAMAYGSMIAGTTVTMQAKKASGAAGSVVMADSSLAGIWLAP